MEEVTLSGQLLEEVTLSGQLLEEVTLGGQLLEGVTLSGQLLEDIERICISFLLEEGPSFHRGEVVRAEPQLVKW